MATRKRSKMDPERLDEDNPEWTQEDFARAKLGIAGVLAAATQKVRDRKKTTKPLTTPSGKVRELTLADMKRFKRLSPAMLQRIGVREPQTAPPAKKRRVKLMPSSGNVFLDLGFDKAEAEVMLLRTDLMISIEKHVRAQRWTKRKAAEVLGISQPRVSKLMKGAWQDFSVEMLVTLALRAGMKVALKISRCL